jgi:hypothetical protein
MSSFVRVIGRLSDVLGREFVVELAHECVASMERFAQLCVLKMTALRHVKSAKNSRAEEYALNVAEPAVSNPKLTSAKRSSLRSAKLPLVIKIGIENLR